MVLLTHLSSGAKAWILLALITLSAALPGVIYMPALDRDESRFAQASKQMLETGDYIQIRYQDEGRNKKPAGIHWLQAASTAAFSNAEAGQIWSYRLPSLIGAVLATLALFWCGQALVGRRASFLGAALFGSGLLLTSEAHISKTDAVLVALTIVAMGAMARLFINTESKHKRRLAYLLWGVLGLSFLIKGPVTMLVAGLAGLVICLVRRDAAWIRPIWDWRPIGLFLVLVLPWFVWVQLATSGEFLDGAVGKDLKDKLVSASEGHGGLPGYHLLYLATHFFPATLLLVPSLVLLWRTLRARGLDTLAAERTGLLFLAAWAGPTWVFFEFLPTKLSHYILPAYPALALVCGWGAVKFMGEARATISRWGGAVLFGLGAAALGVLMSPWGLSALQLEAALDFSRAADAKQVLAQWAPYQNMFPGFLMCGALAALGTLVMFVWRMYGAAILFAIMTSLLFGWHIRIVALPGAVWAQPTVSARLALARVCALPRDNPEDCARQAPIQVRAVGYAEPSLVLTTGTNTLIPPQTRLALPEDPAAYPVAYLLNIEDGVGEEARETLEAEAAAAGRCITASDPVYALNYSNGDPVAFIGMRIDAGPCLIQPALHRLP